MSTAYNLKDLLGRKITGIHLRVFPPHGEEQISRTDIALCLSLAGIDLPIQISISIEDNWTPIIDEAAIETPKAWSLLMPSLSAWMANSGEEELVYHFFETINSTEFCEFIGKNIENIEAVSMSTSPEEYFGVRLTVGDDWLMVYPNVDGSMVESRQFTLGRGLSEFEQSFGEISFNQC